MGRWREALVKGINSFSSTDFNKRNKGAIPGGDIGFRAFLFLSRIMKLSEVPGSTFRGLLKSRSTNLLPGFQQ